MKDLNTPETSEQTGAEHLLAANIILADRMACEQNLPLSIYEARPRMPTCSFKNGRAYS
jgi:hypothetical protein